MVVSIDGVVVVGGATPPAMTIGTVVVSLPGADSQGLHTVARNEFTDGVPAAL